MSKQNGQDVYDGQNQTGTNDDVGVSAWIDHALVAATDLRVSTEDYLRTAARLCDIQAELDRLFTQDTYDVGTPEAKARMARTDELYAEYELIVQAQG